MFAIQAKGVITKIVAFGFFSEFVSFSISAKIHGIEVPESDASVSQKIQFDLWFIITFEKLKSW